MVTHNQNSSNYVFFGRGDFGISALDTLITHGFIPKLVVIPDDVEQIKLKKLANKFGIPQITTGKNQTDLENHLLTLQPSLIVVSSFSVILSSKIISLPPLGCINLHPSLLPKYRGCHPIQWAIINDERYTGITIHYLSETIDSGNILAQKKVLITNQDSINSLKEKLCNVGSKELVRIVKKILVTQQKLKGKSQNHKKTTLAPKRTSKDSYINWNKSTRDIFNLVRCMESPYPNAFSYRPNGEFVEFQESYISEEPGTVIGKIQDYYVVSTGDGAILIKTAKNLEIGEILH